MDTLLQDLRFAVRSARTRPGFTAAAILTLALGVGATVGIFSVVHGVLLRQLPYPSAERIVVFGQVTTETPAGGVLPVSHPNFLDLREAATRLESLALFQSAGVTLTGMGDAAAIPGAQVTPDFFRVFGAELMLGRTFTPEETQPGGPRAIIISWGFWQDRLGGAPDVLEQTLSISGIPRPIVGVTPQGFDYPEGARVFAPFRPNHETCGRGCAGLYGVARLAPGATVAEAEAELAAVGQRLEREYPATNTGISFRVQTLLDYTVGDVRTPLLIVLAAVFMVLLIACANVANLVLARGAGRAAEMAVRAALGAARTRIVRQLLTESMLLAAAGAVLGVMLASWGVATLRAAAPADLPRVEGIAVDGVALGFAVLLVVLTTLAFGLVPALRLSRGLATPLRGSRGVAGPRHGLGRSAILVGEVALAVMLLLGAGLMLRTLAGMQRVELGFDPRGVAAFTIGLPGPSYGSPERHAHFFDELATRLAAAPGIDAAGVLTPVPLGGASGSSVNFVRADRAVDPDSEPVATLRMADGGGLAALGVRLLEGRSFGPLDHADAAPVVLVNASAARRYWPEGSPVGRQIRVGTPTGLEEQPRTVVGVIDDMRGPQLTQPFGPEIIVPYAQVRTPFATVVVRGAQPAAALATARGVVSGMDANLLMVNPTAMQDAVGAQTAATRFYLGLIGGFATLALVLAAVGIYGVLAFLVAGRRREIGVRMALGARADQVARLVLWQGVGPALVGLALGIAAALAAGRIIAGMLYGVAPHDPHTIAGVSAVLAGVAALACLVPALRAARVPPGVALRE